MGCGVGNLVGVGAVGIFVGCGIEVSQDVETNSKIGNEFKKWKRIGKFWKLIKFLRFWDTILGFRV